MALKKLDLGIYALAAVITTIVFTLGVLLGILLNKSQVDYLENFISSLESSVKNVELEFLFLDVTDSKVSCTYFGSEATKLGDLAGRLGSELTQYEQNRQINTRTYEEIKTKYTLVLIQEWLFLEKIKNTCPDVNYTTVLYFYDNEPEKESLKSRQAFVLNYYKELLNEQIMIFALDTTLNIPLLETFERSYNVTDLPSVVIDGRSHYLLTNTTEFENILCEGNQNITVCGGNEE